MLAHDSEKRGRIARGLRHGFSMLRNLAKSLRPGWPAPTVVILTGILTLALIARLAGLTFGLPALLDPDELMFELAAFRMLDQGTLNPGWFGHPATTTIYVLAVINALVFVTGHIGGVFASSEAFVDAIFHDPSLLILPGRVAMVLFAVWSVYLTYRLGRSLFDPATGLLATGLVAVSPVHITWSQVIRTDIMATAFLLAAMLFSLDYLRDGKARGLLRASVLTGVAITTKWPFAVAVLSIAGAILGLMLRQRLSGGDAIRVFALALVTIVATAFVISPFLLLDYGTVLSNLKGEAQQHHVGANGHGLFGNIAFYAAGPLLTALGPIALAAGLVGLTPRRGLREFWLVAGLPAVAMFAVICMQNLVWERWVVPLIPVLAICGAGLIMTLWRARGRQLRAPAGAILAAVGVIAMLASPLYSASNRFIERTNDNRRLATDWARANLPPGSSVLVEHFAFDLVNAPFEVRFPVGKAGCLNARNVLSGRVDYATIDALRGGNSNLDYAAVPKNLLQTCRTDYAIVTEYGRYLAEGDRYPGQVARYRELLDDAEVLQTFRSVSGRIGGRPIVIIAELDQGTDRSALR